MTLEQMKRRAMVLNQPRSLSPLPDIMELAAYEQMRWAEQLAALRASGDPLASFITGTNVELIYGSTSAGTAKSTFTTEVQINDTAGMGSQAFLPVDFFGAGGAKAQAIGQAMRIVARGILSSTATPTYTFTVRGGAAGATSGAIMLGSAALTTGSGVTNQMWEFAGDIVLEAIGAAGANSTLRGIGLISCGGLASPFNYPIWGGAASPGTVATFDTSIKNFINFNVACSASSASNTITILQLLVFGLN